MNTEAVAKRLVDLCREGKFEQAQHDLYADDAVSIEPEGMPGGPTRVEGLPAILEKGKHFSSMIEATHGGHVSDPIVVGSWFTISMTLDVTMKGRGRVKMEEICLYRVRDGKIVLEQFFFDM
jgi:ketosteroid isomerase-like protein